MPGYFVLRIKKNLDLCLSENIIGVGWSYAQALDQQNDWELFKEIILDAYSDIYKGKSRALGNAASSIWRFIYDIKEGDIVLVPTDRTFRIAEVTGPVSFDLSNVDTDLAWRRPVRWIMDDVPRSHAENPLQRRLKARQTCVDATDLSEQIERVRNAIAPIDFVTSAIEATRSEIKRTLLNSLTDYQLEELVAKLIKAGGGSTEILPKNDTRPGDIDVIARYDIPVGHSVTKQYTVAYQIKQHDGMTDEYGIQQLLDRINACSDSETFQAGCLVTTADKVTDEARKLAMADEHQVTIITADELAEWILDTGLSALK